MELTCDLGPDPDLPSLACSSLISLVIALGDTSKILTAVSAILMNPRPHLSYHIVVCIFIFSFTIFSLHLQKLFIFSALILNFSRKNKLLVFFLVDMLQIGVKYMYVYFVLGARYPDPVTEERTGGTPW